MPSKAVFINFNDFRVLKERFFHQKTSFCGTIQLPPKIKAIEVILFQNISPFGDFQGHAIRAGNARGNETDIGYFTVRLWHRIPVVLFHS